MSLSKYYSIGLVVILVALSQLSRMDAFVTSNYALGRSSDQTCVNLQKGWFADDNNMNNGSEDDASDGPVTREMLQRDLLGDPQVRRKRKKKGQGYEPLDNRDHLPFAVKKITPDPYTKPEVKRRKQQKNNKNKDGKAKGSDLDVQLASSRLKLLQSDSDASTLLGEYPLDKATTSGDIITLTNSATGRPHYYKVETARCQYKYAGGQRFVMVRKILEVKEITRAWQEAQLGKLFQSDAPESNGLADEL